MALDVLIFRITIDRTDADEHSVLLSALPTYLPTNTHTHLPHSNVFGPFSVLYD